MHFYTQSRALKDIFAGLNISLLALPLGLSIASASNFPLMAGLLATCAAGFITSFFMGSYATIQGPAAGLIPVLIAGVYTLGLSQAQSGVLVAGCVIIALSFLPISKYTHYIPNFLGQAMLSAIGMSILWRQLENILGIATPLISLWQALGIILSLLCLAGLRFIAIPLPILLCGVGILYTLILTYCGVAVPKSFFISLPQDPWDLLNNIEWITLPGYATLSSPPFWSFVLQLVFVQTLETLLSAQALAKQDPLHRPIVLEKDIFAIGLGSVVSASVGGLPIIVEPVRSQANLQLGAVSQRSNIFHAIFLIAIWLIGMPLLRLIPNYSLSIVLCCVAIKLLNFSACLEILKKPWLVSLSFCTAIALCLGINLFVGIVIGTLVYQGFRQAFKSYHSKDQTKNAVGPA